MAELEKEKEEMTRLLAEGVATAINSYAVRHPKTGLTVKDVREVLLKIVDFIDISEITGHGPWKE
jgi:hypothetical protein